MTDEFSNPPEQGSYHAQRVFEVVKKFAERELFGVTEDAVVPRCLLRTGRVPSNCNSYRQLRHRLKELGFADSGTVNVNGRVEKVMVRYPHWMDDPEDRTSLARDVLAEARERWRIKRKKAARFPLQKGRRVGLALLRHTEMEYADDIVLVRFAHPNHAYEFYKAMRWLLAGTRAGTRADSFGKDVWLGDEDEIDLKATALDVYKRMLADSE